MSGQRYETDSLTNAGNELARVADQIGVSLGTLRDALGSHGSPWGGDEVGKPFGERYTTLVTQAFTAIGSYAEQVAYAGQELPSAAAVLKNREQANVQDLVAPWRSTAGQ